MADDNDCPICYGDLGTPADLCPNGHKVCDTCRPLIQSVLTGWGMGRPGAACPLCRAPIQYVPLPRGVVDDGVPMPHQGAGGPEPHPHAPQYDRLIPFPHQHQPRRGGGRPHRGPDWDHARTQFLAHREAGHIPADAIFGGIHERNCGDRNCQRVGGWEGVRFLLFADTGKRRYRCELHQG
jgi:hypothetical protein